MLFLKRCSDVFDAEREKFVQTEVAAALKFGELREKAEKDAEARPPARRRAENRSGRLADLFAAHGFDASHLFVPGSSRGNEAQTSDSKMNEPPHGGCYEYLDFAPPLKVRADLRAAIEADPGVKAKEQALLDALAAWWETAVPRLANLPSARDPMIIRAEFLKAFDDALKPADLLDRFQRAGALVTWWEEQSDEFKTVAARGFDELMDGWIDTIRDIIEDAESKKEDRDAIREHKLVRRLLSEYLREVEDAAAEVARLEEEKAAFERGPEDDGGDGEPRNAITPRNSRTS